MSAALRATAVLSGLSVVGIASAFTFHNSAKDFSNQALVASEHSAMEQIPKKLPSNFFQISFGQYKWSNARI